MKLKDMGIKEAVDSVNLRRTLNSGFHKIGDEEEEEPNQLSINPYTLPIKGVNMPDNMDTFSYKDSQLLAKMNHDRMYPSKEDEYNTFAREEVKDNEMFKKKLFEYYSNTNPEKTIDPIIQSNLMNYKYEAIDISMAHSLSYS